MSFPPFFPPYSCKNNELNENSVTLNGRRIFEAADGNQLNQSLPFFALGPPIAGAASPNSQQLSRKVSGQTASFSFSKDGRFLAVGEKSATGEAFVKVYDLRPRL